MAALALPSYRLARTLTEGEYDVDRSYEISSSAVLSQRKEKLLWFPSTRGNYNVVVTTNQVPAWVEPTLNAYARIQGLKDDWNSYGGKRTNLDLIISSLSVLTQVMGTASPAPSVVPLADGGLQLEWHRKLQDLEIVFAAGDTAQFFYSNRSTGIEREGFASDIQGLNELLQGIA